MGVMTMFIAGRSVLWVIVAGVMVLAGLLLSFHPR
jgi:hypothetical protein